MAVQIGDIAPDFTLVSSDKKQVSLSDFKGNNVIILFFPMAFTSVCTRELCTMRDTLADYNRLHATVLAISVDSPFTLDRFKSEQQLNFTLLSDFNKEVSQKYDSLYENFVFNLKGVSKRAAFVVDKEGVIQYVEILESAGDLPSFEAIKNILENLS